MDDLAICLFLLALIGMAILSGGCDCPGAGAGHTIYTPTVDDGQHYNSRGWDYYLDGEYELAWPITPAPSNSILNTLRLQQPGHRLRLSGRV